MPPLCVGERVFDVLLEATESAGDTRPLGAGAADKFRLCDGRTGGGRIVFFLPGIPGRGGPDIFGKEKCRDKSDDREI